MPNDLEAEKSLLGAILIDNNSLSKIDTAPSNFYDERNRLIYDAMLSLSDQNKPIDAITLSDALGGSVTRDKVKVEYIVELASTCPTAAQIKRYAEIVEDKALRRRLIEAGQRIITQANSGKSSELIEKSEAALLGVDQRTQELSSIDNILSESLKRIRELSKNKGKLRGVSTGLYDVDRILAGLQRSDLFILAARPSMGKTCLALNLAHNVARTEPVLIFSLEMSKEQLVDRLLSMESGVDAWALKTGDLTDKDLEKVSAAKDVLSERKILIDDTPGITLGDIRSKARKHHNLGLIIVDYIQLIRGRSDNRVQEISEISRGLKEVARELNVPLIALSQLSRSVENRLEKIPQLSDLRDSGSLEQDSDIVGFIYREEYYNPQTDRKNMTDLLIKKHRSGALGDITLVFDKNKQRFLTPSHTNARDK